MTAAPLSSAMVTENAAERRVHAAARAPTRPRRPRSPLALRARRRDAVTRAAASAHPEKAGARRARPHVRSEVLRETQAEACSATTPRWMPALRRAHRLGKRAPRWRQRRGPRRAGHGEPGWLRLRRGGPSAPRGWLAKSGYYFRYHLPAALLRCGAAPGGRRRGRRRRRACLLSPAGASFDGGSDTPALATRRHPRRRWRRRLPRSFSSAAKGDHAHSRPRGRRVLLAWGDHELFGALPPPT